MKFLPQEGKCPHCHAAIQIKDLRKIPFSGSIKWYEFTPGPKQACPHCNRLVRHSMVNSKWLYLPFLVLLSIIGSIPFGIRPSFLAQLIAILVAITGIHMAMRSGKFEPDE